LIRSGTILVEIALMLWGIVIVINRGLQRSLVGEPEYSEETARRVASGDLSVPVNIRGNSEHNLLHAMEEMRLQPVRTVSAIKRSA
jgi:methyl-accepting chemotaxis protein